MIRLDTIKLKFPADLVTTINDASFVREVRSSGGVEVSDKLTANRIGLGCKSIEIDNLKRDVVVELSAKILKGGYFDLININTVNQCFDTINSIGIVKLKTNDVIDQAMLLRADVTKNLVVKGPLSQYVEALNHLRVNNRYKVDTYRQKNNNGIVFQGKQSSFKERMIFYDKAIDVSRDKLLQAEVSLPKLLNDFSHVLRCETNIAQLRKIRELCGGGNSLLSVLKSDANPNLYLFNKVNSKSVNLELFSQFDGMPFYQVEKLMGQQQIIKELQYDMDLIYQFIESRVRGNVSRYKRRYRSLCYEMQQGRADAINNDLLIEIEQQLKVA